MRGGWSRGCGNVDVIQPVRDQRGQLHIISIKWTKEGFAKTTCKIWGSHMLSTSVQINGCLVKIVLRVSSTMAGLWARNNDLMRRCGRWILGF